MANRKRVVSTPVSTEATAPAATDGPVKLNLAKSLYLAWTNNAFGLAPKDSIIRVFAEVGVVPDKDNVLHIEDTEENRQVIRRARVINAKEAGPKLAELIVKLQDMRRFNKDILASSDGAAFEALLKDAEVLASADLVALALDGQRDFREALNRAQTAYKAAQAPVVPKLQARLRRMFEGMGATNQAKILDEYQVAQSPDAEARDVLRLTRKLSEAGVVDPEKVARDAERKPKFSPHNPRPVTPRGYRRDERRRGRGRDEAGAE